MYTKILLASVVAAASAAAGGDGARLAIRSPTLQGNSIQARSINRLLFGRQTCPPPMVLCDTGCFPIGAKCCDFGGACGPDTFCDVPEAGEDGEPGCCPNEMDCDVGGGAVPDPDPPTIPDTTGFAPDNTSDTVTATSEDSVDIVTATGTSIVVVVTDANPTASGGGGLPSTNDTIPSATGQPPPPPPENPSSGAAAERGAPMAVVVLAAIAGLIGLF